MDSKNSLIFLKKQLHGSRRYFFLAVVFIALGSFFNFLGPKLIGVAVDSIIGDIPFDLPSYIVNIIESFGGREFFRANIYIVVAVFMVVTILNSVCEYARLTASKYLSENLAFNMRQSVFERLQQAYFSYHKNVQTGDIIQRCAGDIDLIRNFSVEMTDIVKVIFKILVAYWFMFEISANLALVSFMTIPITAGISITFYSKIQHNFLTADEAEGALQSRVQENLSAPRVVRAFGKQRYERDEFQKANIAFSNLWIKVGNLLAWYWASGDLMTVLQVVVVLVAGTLFAVQGEITQGQIISFMVYNALLSGPIRSLGRIVGNMSKASVSLHRINELYMIDNEDYTSGEVFEFKGDVAFENVSFDFEGVTLFKDLSFTIPSGQTVALLGASGTGKSTILALMARFYTPTKGRITVDGIDIKDINLGCLRKQLGIVMQEPFLFSRTIRENIAISDTTINQEKVEQSAKIACIHQSIDSLQNGYDTIVGEKGVTLSGGQKQRVAIARTLYTGAKILCFDDSLSAVDAITDSNIRHNLNTHTQGITTFIISQRVNTLMQADKILVLDEGKIVAQGTHNELAQQEGIYSSIVRIQQEVIEKTKEEANING